VIELVGLDGDDTLWRNEEWFAEVHQAFHGLLDPYVPAGLDPVGALNEVERRNLELFGYGVKGFTLSMIETAIEVSGGRVSAGEIQRLIELGRTLLARPVELLDGVVETVDALRDAGFRLVIVTKGDLVHQETKVAGSGLADKFDGVEIVSEKDPPTYGRVLSRYGVAAERFVMVGNSVRSDVLPVLAVGARAVHIPSAVTWVHEIADHDGSVPTLASIRELPDWLAGNSPTSR